MAANKKSTKPKNTKIQATEDAELTRLRMRLNQKREYIAILELELFNTRAALHEFSVKYNQRILPLEMRLRTLRRILYETLEAQQDNGDIDPEDFSEPEEPEFTYQEQDSNGWRKINKNKKKKGSPKQEEEIRNLFRELAKRFHPDLTNDPEEKKWREDIMTKVNQAYANRDLKTLKAIAEQPDRPVHSTMQTLEKEIENLKAELKRLDSVIADLKARIKHLEESPAWQLKMEARMQRRSGSDLLTEMAKKLEERIDDLEERLIVMGIDLGTIQEAHPV